MKRNLSILVFLLYLALAFNARAYVFTDDFDQGFYWAHFPIGMNKFVVKTSDGVLLNEVVQDAQSRWEAAIGMPIWSIPDTAITSEKYSGNNIRWSDNFGAETGYDATTTLAVTIRYRVGTYVTRAEIILNGEYGNLKYNEEKLRQVVLHEMGHTIGLGHTTQYGVMQASLNYAAKYLTTDDIDGAIAVVEETLWRQANHYVSPNAEDGGTCGTVSLEASSKGGGPGSFLFSFGLGLVMIMLVSRRQSYLTQLVRN